ncbi:PilZ domain-containing protein [uncultured Gammaproteobacteria bacterium]
MFDFLKVVTKDPKKATPKPVAVGSVLRIDSRTFPLLDLTKKGFVANNHEQRVAVKQLVVLAVAVEEPWGKFVFTTKAEIQAVTPDGKFSGLWAAVLPPEVDDAITVYIKNKKSGAGKTR